MVAKIILDELFKILPYSQSIGDNLEEIRRSISNSDLFGYGIEILAFQAGVGKSHYSKELLKNKDSYLIVTGSHKLLEGEYEDLKAKHWMKFSDKCAKYSSLVKRLDSLGVSKKFICQIQGCDKRKCPYWRQFNTKKAIAPFHYLATDRVLNKDDDFKFDMLLVDEAMDYGTYYNLDENSLNGSIHAMGKYEDVKFLVDLDWDDDLFDDLQANLFLLNNKRHNALIKAMNGQNWADIKNIVNFRPYNLLKYYYYHSIYGNSSGYYEPLMYRIFDLARQKIPILMLDASFDLKAYEVTLAKYIFEHQQKPRESLLNINLSNFFNLQTFIHETKIREKHKTIHRMDKNNFFYKKGLLNQNGLTENGNITIETLKSYIIRTKRKHKNVGIITYQDLEPYFTQLGETEHFFNLRGSNKLKDVDVLFIIGTPQKAVFDILEGYKRLSLSKISHNDIYKPIYKQKDGKNCLYHEYTDYDDEKYEFWDCNSGRGYEEKKPVSYRLKGDYECDYPEIFAKQLPSGEIDLWLWYKFSDYSMNEDESEKYQAIHRARPFLKDNPIIYVFGDIPEKIKEEFNVEFYDKNATASNFLGSSSDFRGVYPIVLWNAIIDSYLNSGLKSIEIAKNFGIYKKDKKGYNTPFITQILKGINLKDIKNIDKFLKENINATYNQIKRKHPNISIEKDIIDYFIYYASPEGAHINLSKKLRN